MQVHRIALKFLGALAANSALRAFQSRFLIWSEQAKGISLSVTAYPNPVTDYLTLSIDKYEISNLTYQLYDMKGKLLQSEKITGNQTSIVMSNLFPASYFLIVNQRNKEVKTFKIIKK